MPRLARLALATVVILGVSVLLLHLLQRKLLYFPDRLDRGAAERQARALGLEPWVSDGEVAGYWARTAGARGVAVVLHGNAGSALDRVYAAAALARASPARPLDVLLVEYPGYGPRPGVPTQATLVAAAREAVAAARRERGGSGPVVVVGESLGSAVGALAAAEAPGEVDGLALVTPLASVVAVAARHYPGLPAWLIRDPFRADEALPRYPGPVAFVVAGRDEVVFADLGLALHEARGGAKRLWVDERATHNTIDWSPRADVWREVVEFVAGTRGP